MTAQRNRGLAQIAGRAEVAAFFDDDFAPAESWLEQCAAIFFREPKVAGANGIVVRDGVKGGPISWQEARRLIAPRVPDPIVVSRVPDLYGCNMAFRLSAIAGLQFDERLVLYGWLEDKDFSRRAAKNGDLVQCNLLIGVHLGLQGGRVSGKKYGYSQVVNAWYLYKKMTMSLHETSAHILRAIVVNGAKAAGRQGHIDRRGRLLGNLLGVAHLLTGSLPTRKGRAALATAPAHSCRTRCTCCMHAEPSPTAAATRFTLPQRTSPTAKIPGILDSKNSGWRAFGHFAAGKSAARKSEPVRTKPLSLRAIQEFSQPVQGSAPIMRKTWPMSCVSGNLAHGFPGHAAQLTLAFQRGDFGARMQGNVGRLIDAPNQVLRHRVGQTGGSNQ